MKRYEAPYRLWPYLNNLRFNPGLLDDIINRRAGYHPPVARRWPIFNRSEWKARAR